MSDEAIAAGAFVVLIACQKYIDGTRKRKHRRRRWWMTTIHKSRNHYDGRQLLNTLIKEPSGEFDNFCRMSSSDFEFLLQQIEPKIEKKNTFWREAIPAKVRLAVTLRFLATGDSYKSLHFLFKISPQIISQIVPEVCMAICEALKGYVKLPASEAEWLSVADGFERKWQFPHCLGAMDGKHFVLQAPFKSGSEFYNYKRDFSVIMLAVADSDCNFLFADIGTHGRMSDGGVFDDSLLCQKICENSANFPNATPLPNRNAPVPYVFLADAAFPLSMRIMKPYPGTHPTSSKNRIFNETLSRSRVVIECTFGILASVFRVFRKPMLLQPKKASIVILTCVLLHNFLKQSSSSKNMYMPLPTDEENLVIQQENSFMPLQEVPRRSAENCRQTRNEFADYFYSRRHN